MLGTGTFSIWKWDTDHPQETKFCYKPLLSTYTVGGKNSDQPKLREGKNLQLFFHHSLDSFTANAIGSQFVQENKNI